MEKATKPRDVVLKVLVDAKRALGAAEIAGILGHLTETSIARSLRSLENDNLVVRQDGGWVANAELVYLEKAIGYARFLTDFYMLRYEHNQAQYMRLERQRLEDRLAAYRAAQAGW